MDQSLKTPLAREIVLNIDPPRVLDTLLSAIEFLNSTRDANGPEIDALIDEIMTAAVSEDPAQIEAVTTRIESVLRRIEGLN
ncbi:hypothetical protein EV667_3001 [Ancylobacter aquaticus]|uniref:Uncharacterized protein n=1 Tax=Ancylobacter aquaticus TaxID=100 RepID=A0A4R1I1D8_ANCAQ|nr:hypothetical protein [Ancylobacter aquaticus]TCK28984.1 hypothetical protein EV667_3001 [Ancylobacter aquaticus]